MDEFTSESHILFILSAQNLVLVRMEPLLYPNQGLVTLFHPVCLKKQKVTYIFQYDVR